VAVILRPSPIIVILRPPKDLAILHFCSKGLSYLNHLE